MSKIFSLLAAAALAHSPADYSLICESNQSVGFVWRSGDYVPANFKRKIHIYSPTEDSDCFLPRTTGHLADAVGLDESVASMGTGIRQVCYKKLGDRTAPFGSFWCHETYIEGAFLKLSCSADSYVFRAETNGFYHQSFMHGNLEDEPENDYKDSLSIEVGRCKLIGK